jgi:Tol biopolymer transport system component
MKILRGWFTWIVVAAVIAVGVVAAVDALRSSDEETSASATTERLASTSQPSPTTACAEGSASTQQPAHPFADIQGWIAFGGDRGIWAIDPTHGGRCKPIQLSDEPAQPVAWSRDGSKLLIVRRSEGATPPPRTDVYILTANGVETRVVRLAAWFAFASLSPDGLKVVYSWIDDSDPDAGIYLVNPDGSDARMVKPRHFRRYPSEENRYLTELFAATFSPDGSQIAYFDGMGDWGNSVRVMAPNGSHVRVLVDSRRGGRQEEAMGNHVYRLAWSSDGSRLVFDTDDGIWVVGSDGSGLRMVIPHGHNPTWSPDGSRLAYATWKGLGSSNAEVQLRIADADGSHGQTFARILWNTAESWFPGPGPWNPLEPASS